MRVSQVLRIDEEHVPPHSTGELLNILFLMNGQWGCVGDYNVTVRVLHSLVGELLWAKPEPKTETENAKTVVN
jgi:hypothetical protein